MRLPAPLDRERGGLDADRASARLGCDIGRVSPRLNVGERVLAGCERVIAAVPANEKPLSIERRKRGRRP